MRHSGYVVPTVQLKTELEKYIEAINAACQSPHTLEGEGWQEYVANRAEVITRGKRTSAATARRLRDVMKLKTERTDASFADAVLLAVGVDIEADTEIQTFPGSIEAAKEMVALRRPELDREEVEHKAEILMKYRDRIIYPDGKPQPKVESIKRRTRATRQKTPLQKATAA